MHLQWEVSRTTRCCKHLQAYVQMRQYASLGIVNEYKKKTRGNLLSCGMWNLLRVLEINRDFGILCWFYLQDRWGRIFTARLYERINTSKGVEEATGKEMYQNDIRQHLLEITWLWNKTKSQGANSQSPEIKCKCLKSCWSSNLHDYWRVTRDVKVKVPERKFLLHQNFKPK
jgi:hypothetical protein